MKPPIHTSRPRAPRRHRPPLPRVGGFGYRSVFLACATVLVCLVSAAPLDAQTRRSEQPRMQRRAALPNLVSLYGGLATRTTESQEVNIALGLDYSRRFGADYGVSALAEWVPGGTLREAAFGALFSAWLSGGLVFRIGPVLELGQPADQEDSEEVAEGTETRGAVRLGLSYFFPLGDQYHIAPSASVDLVADRKPVWLWGVSVGVGF